MCTTAVCAVHPSTLPGSPGGPARLRLRTACSLMRDPMSRYWIRKQGSSVKNRAPSAAGNTMARMPAAEPQAFRTSLQTGVESSQLARLLLPCSRGVVMAADWVVHLPCARRCSADAARTRSSEHSISFHRSTPATEPAAFCLLISRRQSGLLPPPWPWLGYGMNASWQVQLCRVQLAVPASGMGVRFTGHSSWLGRWVGRQQLSGLLETKIPSQVQTQWQRSQQMTVCTDALMAWPNP